MFDGTFTAEICDKIWKEKYRFVLDGEPVDLTISDTWGRIAKSIAQAEKDPAHWEPLFLKTLEGFRFLPAGRIMSGAGTGRNVTLFNCFVMGTVPDDMRGIFDSLTEAALTMQQGGGIGYDFSTIRPSGALVKGVGADASGPLSFMDVWDSMCKTIMSAGSRRGAMMATMRCDHPDIEAFIDAKSKPGRLRMFNMSVLITDPFMDAVKNGLHWNLMFNGQLYKTINARDLWDRIMRATYDYAEPGVIFIDRVNQLNNLGYCETINSTNPCGEEPLPPYGACLLGSLNLASMVEHPFTDDAWINPQTIKQTVAHAVRMLDNVIDVSNFALPQQQQEAVDKRRVGLGFTGLADALVCVGLNYGSSPARKQAADWARLIVNEAYMASVELAKEKGPFPKFDKEAYLKSQFVQSALDQDVIEAIAEHGIRNSHLTSIAPTGTISLLANNVSGGLEPMFSYSYDRKILKPDGTHTVEQVQAYAYRLFKDLNGPDVDLPDTFVTAETLKPADHVLMQGAIQQYVDSAISKTINVPKDIDFEAFKDVYMLAWEEGCKGCTTYRPNEVTGSVLSTDFSKKEVDKQGASLTVSLQDKVERPEVLDGKTYRVKRATDDHSTYVTITDYLDEKGQSRPFEMFIATKNPEHGSWMMAVSRMVSAVFRRGGDVAFVAEELKQIHDPLGGSFWKGKYCPSLIAAVGRVLEDHMMNQGLIARDEPSSEKHSNPGVVFGPAIGDGDGGEASTNGQITGKTCPKCHLPTVYPVSGCDTCTACGWSKCG